MRSILHSKEEKTCYLCRMLHGDYRKHTVLHEHHCIYGRGRRQLSEKYGLKVYLCMEHHVTGEQAVHRNAKTALLLKQEAQKKFMEHFPDLDFREVFGKNYITDPPKKQEEKQEKGGFYRIEDGIEGMDW